MPTDTCQWAPNTAGIRSGATMTRPISSGRMTAASRRMLLEPERGDALALVAAGGRRPRTAPRRSGSRSRSAAGSPCSSRSSRRRAPPRSRACRSAARGRAARPAAPSGRRRSGSRTSTAAELRGGELERRPPAGAPPQRGGERGQQRDLLQHERPGAGPQQRGRRRSRRRCRRRARTSSAARCVRNRISRMEHRLAGGPTAADREREPAHRHDRRRSRGSPRKRADRPGGDRGERGERDAESDATPRTPSTA